MSLQTAITDHLEWWGLHRFDTDDAYFQWQRGTLNSDELGELHRLVERKRNAPGDAQAETAFYDKAAAPRILPVLYSQRYDYYLAVGPHVAERIGRTARGPILDFGCGIGLLTTFYARQFHHLEFVGVDRSAVSIGEAEKRTRALGLNNLRFACLDVAKTPLRGTYDLILSSHALLQAEHDPGLPSLTWQAFERARDASLQRRFEDRTRLAHRLNVLCEALTPAGHLVVFEKARLLARRIPFQRALANRGFHLVEPPVPVPYRIVEEESDDGPLYVMTRGAASLKKPEATVEWNEEPEPGGEGLWFRCMGRAAEFVKNRLPDRTVLDEQLTDSPFGRVKVGQGRCGALLAYCCWEFLEKNRQFLMVAPVWTREHASDLAQPFAGDQAWPGADEQDDTEHVPLYENHTGSAQALWRSLPGRTVLTERTWDKPDGYQMHVEMGTAGGLIYLYQANTFDQRQLVLMEPARRTWLEQYYQEILALDQPPRQTIE